LEAVGYVGEEQNKQLTYLIATSRKLSKPLSAIVRSESGAGKSYLMECVAELMPPEEVQYFSRLTPQSLYYMGKDELVHKLLIVDERDGSEEAEYPIRTLQTRRKLTLAVPVKDPSSGKIQTKQIEILGPIAYMESTTSAAINPENANRSFEIFLDVSDEQTRRIYVAQQKSHTLEGWKVHRQREEVLRRHHNAQRLLKPVKVLIPYTGKIKFPVSWTRGRRDHDRLLCLIEVIAFLHQFQRETRTGEEGEYIEATLADYALAYELARTAFAHALTDMPREARLLLSHIRAMVKEWSERLSLDEKDYGFRRRDVREYTKQPDHLVKRAMRMLEELEYLHVRRSGRGGSFVYHLAKTPADKDPLDGLTTPEQLRQAWANPPAKGSPSTGSGSAGG
jgi:ABC-type dipeptide/oligopeptide/nickel transport system ATPase component